MQTIQSTFTAASGALIQRMLAPENLRNAWNRVRANKGCAGADRITIEAFSDEFDKRLDTLRSEIAAGAYRPRPHARALLPKAGKAPRCLAIPTVRDRVAQTAVYLQLAPLFDARFSDCSFAYRPQRCVAGAVARVSALRDAGLRWVVDADIAAFFDEIDHGLLFELIEEWVAEPDVVALIRQWTKGAVTDGRLVWRPKRGVAQGGPLSPLLANLYLNGLDRAAEARGLALVRYADDCLVLCASRNEAEGALEFCAEQLERLKLRLNRGKSRIVHFDEGFVFLGVHFRGELAEVESPAAPRQPLAKPEPHRVDRHAPEVAERVCASASHGPHEHRSRRSDDAESRGFEQADEDAQAWASDRADPLMRTLYLLRQGAYISKDGERLVVRHQRETLQEMPIAQVDQIMIFGNSSMSTPAMHWCLARGIPVYLMSQSGRLRGAIDPLDTAHVTLQRTQFERAADPVFCLEIARQMVRAKIANSQVALRRIARRHPAGAIDAALRVMDECRTRAPLAFSLDQLRGFEGTAARAYFQAIGASLAPEWGFSRRMRQPPPDPVNALLSFGYAVLTSNAISLARARGLSPHVGFLHAVRPGHPALASDLIEEFRAIAVDTVVLNLLRAGRVVPSEFAPATEEHGICRIGEKARRALIEAFEARMNAPLTHSPGVGRVELRRCMDEQVKNLVGVLAGTAAAYTPLVLR